MRQCACGISFLLHPVNLFLFTLLLVHLILHTSSNQSLCLYCQHLSPHSVTDFCIRAYSVTAVVRLPFVRNVGKTLTLTVNPNRKP